MSLYKSKNSPYWQYDFQIGGLRFHGSTGTADKGKARTIESKIRTDAAEGRRLKKRDSMTLNAAAALYYEQVGAHKASAADIDYQLANLVNGLGKDTALEEITDARIAEYVARRRGTQARRRRDLVSNATVNREVQLLRRVLRRAEKVWKPVLGDMPAWTEHLLPEPDERIRSLSDGEEAQLLAKLPEDLRVLVTFCMMTGFRLNNAIRLTWAQVDKGAALIRYRVKSKKPGGENKELPITRAAAALLAGRRGGHPIFVFTYRCAKNRHLRRQGERYPFSKNGWRKAWKAALEAAGVEDFRFHDLRHTAATRTLRASGNLKVIQKMLGHSDIATTARYAHVIHDDVRAAMEAAQSRNTPGMAQDGSANKLKEKA